jgi:signal transduction histidine kinase
MDAVFAELDTNAEWREVRLAQALELTELRVDEDLFRRVMTNLVENAIRYAPAGTTVTVTSAAAGGQAELRVIDHGDGIAPELRDQVFDPFVQLGSVERSGRGLGLTFCKLATEAHGGTIRVEDATPGATFCVRIPDGS